MPWKEDYSKNFSATNSKILTFYNTEVGEIMDSYEKCALTNVRGTNENLWAG